MVEIISSIEREKKGGENGPREESRNGWKKM